MHATEPFTHYSCRTSCDRMLIRAHENAARGHIAFSHFGDAAAIISACGLGSQHTSGAGMLPSAKAHAYARPIHAHLHYPVYDMHMHICTRCTMYTHMRVP